MKKFAIMFVAAMFAFAMAGCGSNAGSSASGSDAASGEGAASAEASADGEEVTVVQGEIAWSDSETGEDAASNAGIYDGFTVPNPPQIGDYEWADPIFSSMENVVEAHFNGGAVGVSIRKGQDVPLEELSADLNDYKFDWTQYVDGIEVYCHGYEEGLANFLEWQRDNDSYNVWCMSTGEGNIGMTESEVAAMVSGVR